MAQTFHVLANQPVGPAPLVSPTVVVPAGITDVLAVLVLAPSSPNWTSPQVAGALWEWAIEFQNASGNFEPLVSQLVANGNPLAVGQLGKAGILPMMGVSRLGLPGMTLRGWCRCSQTVNTSMDITIVP